MTLLEQYRENEDNNYHAENYVLLANRFGTKEHQKLAQQNLDFCNKYGYSDDSLRNRCYQGINPFYKKLLKNDLTKPKSEVL